MTAPLDNGGWIRLDEFCTKHNQRKNTIQKRVHDDIWKAGEIYSCPDGGIAYIHEERALAWLREHGKLNG